MERRRRKSGSPGSPARLKAKTIDASERRLLDAVERGEWISVEQLATARSRYTRFATATRRLRDP
jgi:hypothetical protein